MYVPAVGCVMPYWRKTWHALWIQPLIVPLSDNLYLGFYGGFLFLYAGMVHTGYFIPTCAVTKWKSFFLVNCIISLTHVCIVKLTVQSVTIFECGPCKRQLRKLAGVHENPSRTANTSWIWASERWIHEDLEMRLLWGMPCFFPVRHYTPNYGDTCWANNHME